MKKRLIFLVRLITILVSTAIVGSFLGALLLFVLQYIGNTQLYLWGALFGYQLKILIENYRRAKSVPLSGLLVDGHEVPA
jgi:hypothetical protein